MMRKAIFIGLTGWLTLTSLSVMADTKNIYKDRVYKDAVRSNWSEGWFAGVGIGGGPLKVASTSQRVYYTPDPFFDTYSTNDTKSTFPIASVEGGYRWSNAGQIPFAYFLGLRYRYLSTNNMSGNILVLNDPAFPYGFNYDTSAQTFSLFAKIDLIELHGFSPYITGGIGGVIMRFSNYSEYPKSDVSIARDSAAFASNSSYNFTYDLGAGIDYYVTQNWLVSLGYDYLNFGKLKTGNGAFNTLTGGTNSLNFGNVTANTVFLQTDYLFNA